MGFTVNGLDDLGLTIKELAEIPNEVVAAMLEAQANVLLPKLRDAAPVETGKLKLSIKEMPKKDKNGRPIIDIYPSGTHHRYKTRQGGSRAASANDVGFVNEFGAPARGIKGTGWMRLTVESCADEANAAALDVYDKYLASKKL